jgi:hypothetical protein
MRDRTEDKEQEQKQKQRLGGISPDPLMEKDSTDPDCMELERVWKEVTEAPCYRRNFAPLLEHYPVQHISAVIRWVFTVSSYWKVKNTGCFCKQTTNGSFPVFDQISVQYERYMQAAREGAEKEAQKAAPRAASELASVLNPSGEQILEDDSDDEQFTEDDSDVEQFSEDTPDDEQFPEDDSDVDTLLEPDELSNTQRESSLPASLYRQFKRIPGSSVTKTAITAPVQEDFYLTSDRCISTWKWKHPGRPYDKDDFEFLLDNFDEDRILYAIENFTTCGNLSEEIRNSTDFCDQFPYFPDELTPPEAESFTTRSGDRSCRF